MRGRKPKPTYLRVLDGNAGRRPVNADEPVPPGRLDEVATAPDHLTDDQKRIWERALKNSPPGLLRKLDWAVFEQWVVHHSNFLEAAAKVAKSGQLVKKGDGWDWNPYMSIMNKQSALALKAAAELGFTPSSRSRVKVEKQKPGKGSTFADLRELSVD